MDTISPTIPEEDQGADDRTAQCLVRGTTTTRPNEKLILRSIEKRPTNKRPIEIRSKRNDTIASACSHFCRRVRKSFNVYFTL